MDQPLITPTAIIDQLGLTPITLRRWSQYHAAHLSPLANPGAGQARRFTGRDLEVLRHVQSLRDQGMTTALINEQLATLTFAEIDTDSTSTDTHAISLPNAQDAQDDASDITLALHAITTMRSDIDALKAFVVDSRHGQRDYMQGIGVGFVAALLFMIAIIGMAVLYGGFR